jgi:hypothetical protein
MIPRESQMCVVSPSPTTHPPPAPNNTNIYITQGLCVLPIRPGTNWATIVMRLMCAACGASGTMRCGGCNMVNYCGPLCQRRHWAAHREACQDGGLRRFSRDEQTANGPVYERLYPLLMFMGLLALRLGEVVVTVTGSPDAPITQVRTRAETFHTSIEQNIVGGPQIRQLVDGAIRMNESDTDDYHLVVVVSAVVAELDPEREFLIWRWSFPRPRSSVAAD